MMVHCGRAHAASGGIGLVLIGYCGSLSVELRTIKTFAYNRMVYYNRMRTMTFLRFDQSQLAAKGGRREVRSSIVSGLVIRTWQEDWIQQSSSINLIASRCSCTASGMKSLLLPISLPMSH